MLQHLKKSGQHSSTREDPSSPCSYLSGAALTEKAILKIVEVDSVTSKPRLVSTKQLEEKSSSNLLKDDLLPIPVILSIGRGASGLKMLGRIYGDSSPSSLDMEMKKQPDNDDREREKEKTTQGALYTWRVRGHNGGSCLILHADLDQIRSSPSFQNVLRGLAYASNLIVFHHEAKSHRDRDEEPNCLQDDDNDGFGITLALKTVTFASQPT
eukprot:jgi/Bigna1/135340/aug1.29_g10048